MCDDETKPSKKSLLPPLSRVVLDQKAAQFCRRLIERWVRDPSNIRLLRVALDVYPDERSLSFVLDLLWQYLEVGAGRKGPRRVAWYCIAELLKAGATETGLVHDADCLPAGVDLLKYQSRLIELAQQILLREQALPWYLVQQAYLYLACAGRYVSRNIREGAKPHLRSYRLLHHALDGRPNRLMNERVVPLVLVQSWLQGPTEGASTFIAWFRQQQTATQRASLLQVIKENGSLALEIYEKMGAQEKQTWCTIYQIHSLIREDGFPKSVDVLPVTETSFPLVSVSRSSINPFVQEYAALKFVLAFMRQYNDNIGLLFPWRVRIRVRDWRALWHDRFPIPEDHISLEFSDSPEPDVRFVVPEWVDVSDFWKYQLGQLLRALLTGSPDYTLSAERVSHALSHMLYAPYTSSWLRRRYGLYNGRSAFGPPWLPISPWFGSLLSRLLEWPGSTRSDFGLGLQDNFDEEGLKQLVVQRIGQLDEAYGRASYTVILPIQVAKSFMRNGLDTPSRESLNSMRVGVVQTALPTMQDFTGDPELNDPIYRRRHRRHLAAVLGGVHRMLQVRETHSQAGAGIELLILPELSIHPDDIRPVIVPFVNQHRCMVFGGVVFHPIGGGPNHRVNSGYWIIPVRSSNGGLYIEVLEQGKWNLTGAEQQLGITPFRPVQWILDFVDPPTRHSRNQIG